MAFAIIVGGMAHALKMMHPPEHGLSWTIPVNIGAWKGSEVECDRASLMSATGAQEIIFRTYRDGPDSIKLYMAFYKDVDSADSMHAPKVCYAGQGWLAVEDDVVGKRLGPVQARVNRLVFQKPGEGELVYSWWQTGGRIIPRNSFNRFYQMYLSLSGRPTSTVWVRISRKLKGDPAREEESVIRFCREFMMALHEPGGADDARKGIPDVLSGSGKEKGM